MAKVATFFVMLAFWVIMSGMFDSFHLPLGVFASWFSGRTLHTSLKHKIVVWSCFLLAAVPWGFTLFIMFLMATWKGPEGSWRKA